ncbi:hypothetical protein OUZ56_027456 [Daphnia magna]|uniref:Protein kinase domain-containing protein n=1 Tax=Daphnia magna TaxID=35525 RepID=A0ABQ9ZPT9_9CRUS|nr:hypothetical protein OUZ56_027456 [Daphnia magna]
MEEIPIRKMRQISIATDKVVLGIGGFGFILKGKYDGREVAVKRVPLEDQDLNEEEAMLKLDHANIVKLFHCESDKNFRYYALELCVASLDHLFLKTDDEKKYNGPMPHHIKVIQQLASGLEHIHSKDLVHGDIRPENVLISVGSAGPDEITIKWADFGLNRNVDVQGTAIKSEARGKNAWLAPELLKLSGTKNHGTAKGDIFAQGLVFGSLFLNGEHLYGSMENGNEIRDNIIKGNPFNMQKIDGKLRDDYENDLLKKMLEHDPDKRMTSTQVVNQLKTINKNVRKEEELLELCGRDSRLDLTDKIQNFIQFGINLNAKDGDGRNALHLLCRNYSSPKLTDAIKLLIENKIDVNAKDNDGLNAIHYLCRYHSSQNLIKAIEILIHFGIDAKATTNDGSNALHYLCRYNSNTNLYDVIKIFTKLGMDLLTKDYNGWNAFYYLDNKDKQEMKILFNRDAVLGQGGFGVVFKGKFGGREVAVKRVDLLKVDKREEEALLKLDHPNIVKLFHCEKDNDFMYYAMELCDASLDQLFLQSNDHRKYKGPIPRHIEAFQQLASGLEHIHSKKLIHRGIKPSNILISATPARRHIEVTLKWAGFGLAKSVNEKGLHSWPGVKGAITRYAPELLKKLIYGEKAEQEEFWGTVQSDVFVLGLVFGYLFLKGEHLYGSSETEIHENIIEKNPVNMQKIDGVLRQYYEDDLLRKMLEHDPVKRMTSTQVVHQLKAIKYKIAGKEKELLELCGRDNRLDLTENIKNFIQLEINLNAKDDGGRNALHLLCRNYSSPKLTDAIKLLIENKTDVNAKDNDGLNAIHFLCRYHSSQNLIKAIQILIQFGIDAKATTNDGSNALHYLSRYNSTSNLLDAIDILIQIGVDAQAKDKDGWNVNYYLYNKDKKEMKIWLNRDAVLGQGGFAAVFKGKFGGREVAVKRVELFKVDKREEDAMLKLEHPNIVKLLHVEKDNDFKYYALELCVASLDQLFLESDDLQKYKGPMPSQIKVFSQLARGLEHIHSKKLIHRDIKPSNILIMKSPGKNEEIIIKWSDFGMAKSVNEKGLHSWSGAKGTRTWYAPEVLKKLINGEKAEQEEFWGTVQSDGEHLYGSSETEIHKNIIEKNPVNMQKINGELRKYYDDDLLMKMLEHDPKKRITSEEVVYQLKLINNKEETNLIVLIQLGIELNEKQEELNALCFL